MLSITIYVGTNSNVAMIFIGMLVELPLIACMLLGTGYVWKSLP